MDLIGLIFTRMAVNEMSKKNPDDLKRLIEEVRNDRRKQSIEERTAGKEGRWRSLFAARNESIAELIEAGLDKDTAEKVVTKMQENVRNSSIRSLKRDLNLPDELVDMLASMVNEEFNEEFEFYKQKFATNEVAAKAGAEDGAAAG